MATPIGYSEIVDSITSTFATAPCDPGAKVFVDGTEHQLIYNASATTSIGKYSLCYRDVAAAGSFACMPDGSSALGFAAFAGIAQVTIPPAEYGWVAIGGRCTGYGGEACATIGWPLFPSAATNGALDTVSAAGEHVVAHAMAIITVAGNMIVEL